VLSREPHPANTTGNVSANQEHLVFKIICFLTFEWTLAFTRRARVHGSPFTQRSSLDANVPRSRKEFDCRH
jgi:hypothetical protein